jgi:hypothetical protein
MLGNLQFVKIYFGMTWKFIFGMPKSYSLSKFTLVGAKSLHCTEQKFTLNKPIFFFFVKINVGKIENNFCLMGSSPCVAWKFTFDMTKNLLVLKFALAKLEIYFLILPLNVEEVQNLFFC